MFAFYKPGEIIKTHIRKRQAEGATFIAIFTREKSFLGFSYKKYYLADLKNFTLFNTSKLTMNQMDDYIIKIIEDNGPGNETYEFHKFYENYADLAKIKENLTGEMTVGIFEDGAFSANLVLSPDGIYVDMYRNGKFCERRPFYIYDMPDPDFSDWDAKSEADPKLTNRDCYASKLYPKHLACPQVYPRPPFQNTTLPQSEEIMLILLNWEYYKYFWEIKLKEDREEIQASIYADKKPKHHTKKKPE